MSELVGARHIKIDVPGSFSSVFRACVSAVGKTDGIQQEKTMCGYIIFKSKRSFTCNSASLYISVTEKETGLCSVSLIVRSYDSNVTVRTYWRLIYNLSSYFQNTK